MFTKHASKHMNSVVREIKNCLDIEKTGTCTRARIRTPPHQKVNFACNSSQLPIYVATDVQLTSPYLKSLYANFKCIFSIGDFADDLGNVEKYTKLRSGRFVKLELLIPFIEQVVVGSGDMFMDFPHSTFSRYAQRIHMKLIKRLP